MPQGGHSHTSTMVFPLASVMYWSVRWRDAEHLWRRSCFWNSRYRASSQFGGNIERQRLIPATKDGKGREQFPRPLLESTVDLRC